MRWMTKDRRQTARKGVAQALSMLALLSIASMSGAAPVALTNATATFSQAFAGPFLISHAIDGITTHGNGWAIDPVGPAIKAETAVFETASDVGSSPGGTFTFTLRMNYSTPPFAPLIGKFRLSVTTDDRSTFADGNQGTVTPGDVSANWIPLTPLSFTSLEGNAYTINGDDSILVDYVAGTGHPTSDEVTDTYTVVATSPLAGITGVRLETLEDPSLPGLVHAVTTNGGPGMYSLNGNFVLTEFEVDFVAAVPEPSSGLLLMLGTPFLRRRTNGVGVPNRCATPPGKSSTCRAASRPNAGSRWLG